MKAEVKIPKGWRRVRKGLSKDGDHSLRGAFIAANISWGPTDVGNTIGPLDIYIRRKRARRVVGKGGK